MEGQEWKRMEEKKMNRNPNGRVQVPGGEEEEEERRE
jgi:hypothetical protein